MSEWLPRGPGGGVVRGMMERSLGPLMDIENCVLETHGDWPDTPRLWPGADFSSGWLFASPPSPGCRRRGCSQL